MEYWAWVWQELLVVPSTVVLPARSRCSVFLPAPEIFSVDIVSALVPGNLGKPLIDLTPRGGLSG